MLQFRLHGVDNLGERTEFPLEQRMNVLTLFGGSSLADEVREVFVEMYRPPLTVPDGKVLVLS